MTSASDPKVHAYRPANKPVIETIVRFEKAKGSTSPATAAESTPSKKPMMDASGRVREIGGRKDGTEPTRYGDWEKNGRCIDF